MMPEQGASRPGAKQGRVLVQQECDTPKTSSAPPSTTTCVSCATRTQRVAEYIRFCWTRTKKRAVRPQGAWVKVHSVPYLNTIPTAGASSTIARRAGMSQALQHQLADRKGLGDGGIGAVGEAC